MAWLGAHVVEMYSIRDTTPEAATSTKKDFCIKPCENGAELSRSHQYYVQIQGQLAITDRWYCDFVCWTPHGMYIERIERDLDLFNRILPKLTTFFVCVILPELLQGPGNLLQTKDTQSTHLTAQIQDQEMLQLEQEEEQEEEPEEKEYCYCRKGEYGSMVACDNPECPNEWFHFDCVNITSPPEGEWFCPTCQ